MKIITIGPVYIRGWAEGIQGWIGCWQKLKQRSKKTQIIEFKVAMMSACIPQRANIIIIFLDRRTLTVEAISGPLSRNGSLLWRHLTSC